jgi:hypothetical protein
MLGVHHLHTQPSARASADRACQTRVPASLLEARAGQRVYCHRCGSPPSARAGSSVGPWFRPGAHSCPLCARTWRLPGQDTGACSGGAGASFAQCRPPHAPSAWVATPRPGRAAKTHERSMPAKETMESLIRIEELTLSPGEGRAKICPWRRARSNRDRSTRSDEARDRSVGHLLGAGRPRR